MKPTERIAKSASTPKAGFFTTLYAFPHVKGTGLSKAGSGRGAFSHRRSGYITIASIATVIGLVGALTCAAPPAVASPTPPETPDLMVESIAPTTASFDGILNPVASEPTKAGMGTYRFLYRASETGCTGAGGKETSPSGLSLGGPAEAVSEPVSGLTPGTAYTVCLSVTNLEGQTALSAPVPFTTTEAPVTSSPAKAITSTTATLEGTLNPAVEAETGYYFAYSTTATCTEAATSAAVEATVNGRVKNEKVAAALSGLEPNTTYTFCLVATDAEGGVVEGNQVSFKTSVSKPTVIGLSSAPKAEEARLEATVNPSDESTECRFQYGEASVSEHAVACEQGATPGTLEGGEQGVSANVTGLKPNTTYKYKALLKNATGETSEEATLTTAIHPETPTGLKVEAITATEATLHGVLNAGTAGNAGSYEFVYRPSGKSPSDCQGEGEAVTSEPATGATPEPVSTTVTSLIPNAQYTVCLRARNTVGEESMLTAPVMFATTPLAPSIESESSTVVSATEARLEATINPGNAETEYHFEYGSSAGSYDVSVPGIGAHIPAGLNAESVSTAVTGLKPGTTYHYRVVASNALPGVVEYGPDQTFTTPAAAANTGTPGSCENEQRRAEQPYGLALPDCRAYEMVSPTNTNGQDATSASTDDAPRASEALKEEPAIAYAANGSYGTPKGSLIENQYVSRRTTKGWGTQAVSPLSSTGNHGAGEPHTRPYPTTYFTAELTAGLAVTSAELGEAPLLGEAYGVYVAQFASSTYQYVGPTGANDVPWGTSNELGRVVLTSPETEGLVESASGADTPVSVTNAGEAIAASAGAAETSNGFAEYKDAWHSTSENGSTVYFTTPPETRNSIGQLFVRVNIGEKQSALGGNGECLEASMACTIEVSASTRSPEDPAGPKAARYWGASADGGKVFFTSDSELTQHAYTGPADSAANLYEYDLETHQLNDLTGDETDASGEGAAVQGVVQISDEGSYVYFVANGALATGATAGKPNLYMSHDGGSPRFIATLAAGDSSDWNNEPAGLGEAGPEINTAVATPNGSRLAFSSQQSLPTVNFPAGYDNDDAVSGRPDSEVYEYSAPSPEEERAGGSGTLVCASCNPTGARPVGSSGLPGVDPDAQAFADYRPRDFLGDGTLFFDSSDALVPHASDGRQNVYEDENGAIHAISDVAGGYESFFLDASPNGENVFFASANRLLPEDPGGNTVVWDARVDGGFPVVTLPPSCDNADSCKSPESPQPGVFAPPASLTFSGPGNPAPPPSAVVKPAVKPKTLTRAQKLATALKVCAKDKQKSKRAKCQKQAKQKYGATKAKKSSNDRRGM